LIEMIIVMLVAAILLTIVAPKFLGARHSADRRQYAATANAYVDAITAFGLERAGRVPVLGAAADWPTAATGPLDPLLRPYMRSGPPELVQDGKVAVGGASVTTPPGGNAVIEYRWGSRSTYLLQVREYKSGALIWRCETGTATRTPGVDTC